MGCTLSNNNGKLVFTMNDLQLVLNEENIEIKYANVVDLLLNINKYDKASQKTIRETAKTCCSR